MAEHLGPIADFVFDDAIQGSEDFCDTPEHAHQLIDKLALDIENSIEIEQFRSKAYRAFDQLLEN